MGDLGEQCQQPGGHGSHSVSLRVGVGAQTTAAERRRKENEAQDVAPRRAGRWGGAEFRAPRRSNLAPTEPQDGLPTSQGSTANSGAPAFRTKNDPARGRWAARATKALRRPPRPARAPAPKPGPGPAGAGRGAVALAPLPGGRRTHTVPAVFESSRAGGARGLTVAALEPAAYRLGVGLRGVSSQSPRTLGNSPTGSHTNPASSCKFPPRGFSAPNATPG